MKLVYQIGSLCAVSTASAFVLQPSIFRSANTISSQLSMKAIDHAPEYKLEVGNGATAMVRTYGGCVFSYVTKDGVELLGKRNDAVKDDSKPYAGGAPHCFPQFGPGELPQHGLARQSDKWIPVDQTTEENSDKITLKLETNEDTKAVWDADFEYLMEVTLLPESLVWDISITNKGSKDFECTHGLHTYWDVSSLSNVKVAGPFTGSITTDKITGEKGHAESDEIVIDSAVDKLYSEVSGPVSIIDEGKGIKTIINRTGYADTVLWSPYGNEDQGYDKFLCVEPVTASPVIVKAGKTLKYSKTVTYEKL